MTKPTIKNFFDAIRSGTYEEFQEILDSGFDVNLKDETGWHSLFWAVDQGDVTKVSSLLKAGADVDLQDNDGQTPLHIATFLGHMVIVDVLLAAGADVNVLDRNGCSAQDVMEEEYVLAADLYNKLTPGI